MALKRKLSTSSESTASMMPALLRYASSASASAGAYELIKKGNNQNKWKRTILHLNPKASMIAFMPGISLWPVLLIFLPCLKLGLCGPSKTNNGKNVVRIRVAQRKKAYGAPDFHPPSHIQHERTIYSRLFQSETHEVPVDWR